MNPEQRTKLDLLLSAVEDAQWSFGYAVGQPVRRNTKRLRQQALAAADALANWVETQVQAPIPRGNNE